MKKKNGHIDWNTFSDNVEKVLGEDFWNEMHHVIPKRGPSYDFYENQDQGVVVVELPGLKKDDPLHLTQKGTHMILQGKITPRYSVPVEELLHDERLKGTFKRIIPIPFHFSIDDVVTSYEDGLLTITIFKRHKNNKLSIHLNDR
ncbi:Hsp20/alpha crystallin family protein [Halobacillus litoralis]|uniref:Hsp20/alpha crystallin family protein n=1 Tax=Halobacillus litoralis TaxID=45668 RepID=UPI001CFD5C4B|nr:Hsp20/alpha crystallin family protein [Halobacillus litoralis]